MHRTTTALGVLIAAVISLFATSANSQTPSQTPPAVESWEQPEEPVRIVGPIYFVGTKGLGVFLFTTPEGHILMNTGMPSSGPMIEESIRKLGFKPGDIKLMINSHAHIDHAGAFATSRRSSALSWLSCRMTLPPWRAATKMTSNTPTTSFTRPSRSIASCATVTQSRWAMCCSPPITHLATPGARRPGLPTSSSTARPYVVAFPDGAGFNPGLSACEESRPTPASPTIIAAPITSSRC